MYFNGSASTGLTIALNGVVANGDVFVLAQSSANATILAQADQTNGAGWFNGDDAIVLRKGGASGAVIDSIGQVGFDPGTEWGTGLTSTADNTVRRKASVTGGDTNPSDVFDPSIQWDGFATDTFDNLGAYSTGGTTPLSATGAATPASVLPGDPVLLTVTVTPATGPASTGIAVTADLTSIGGPASQPFFDNGTNGDVTDSNNTFSFQTAVAPATTTGPKTIPVAVTDGQSRSAQATIALAVPTAPRIRDIQGAAHISPLNNQAVAGVVGVVTAVAGNGFYFQDPDPDSNPATSEGLFVFRGSGGSKPAVGDLVRVAGTVSEFRPGNSAVNLTTTQITATAAGSGFTVQSSGNPLPAPTVIGAGGRVPPTAVINDDTTGSVETGGSFDPATDGIDFYESLEGMRVQVNNPVVVGPTNNFGEVWVLADDGAGAGLRTDRGGIIIQAADYNPERIQLEDILLNPPSGGFVTPLANVGDHLSAVVGVMDYDFNNFEIRLTALPTVTPGGLQREATALTPTAGLTVATFNVENLDAAEPDAKFAALAGAIVNNLKSPDILAIEEIQDNNGVTNDAVVDASATWQKLIAAIAAAGGPTYQYRQIDPVNNADGGEPGGNIRVGFLFNPQRVQFVDIAGGGPTANTTVSNVGGIPTLSASPGRLSPTDAAFSTSRKPLIGQFTFQGRTVYAIANHFNSKGGDQPLFGPNQPPVLSSEAQRRDQATIVANVVRDILAIDANAAVVVLGDLNDFEFSAPLQILEAAGLTTLIETLPANQRYTYNFQGNAQSLDHILVSDALRRVLLGYDVVHFNSEFADQLSDHDPQVASFDLVPPTVSCSVSPASIWPPNHKLENVTLAVSVTDAGGSGPAGWKLISVTSSEPDSGTGDGDVPGDIAGWSLGTPDTAGQLRAERSGAGSGRTYTFVVEGSDQAGNTARCTAIATVPHDQGNRKP